MTILDQLRKPAQWAAARLTAATVVCAWAGMAPAAAWAGTGLTWANASDMLAIGLPALAAGSAWSQSDGEGFKQLTLSMATTVGTAEVLKRTVHSMRPDGSDNKSFPSAHTAVAFAAVRFMDKRYGQDMAPYTPWLYAAAAMTGVARVEAKKHHWQDVLAGGALGWGASHLWAEPVQGGQLSVLPASGGLALAWHRAW
jgi:membrane-associated phospholipid phosphatase